MSTKEIVYIGTMSGAYLQEVVGVYSTLEIAKAAIEKRKQEEEDNYHAFTVYAEHIDEGKVLGVWNYAPEHSGWDYPPEYPRGPRGSVSGRFQWTKTADYRDEAGLA